MRKLCAIIISVMLVFGISGCSYETRIDKAYIAETVTVQKGENGFVYSFFMVSNSDTPELVSIECSGFEEACILARQNYIPDLLLANLELFIVSDEVYIQTLYNDVNFMASQCHISPKAYVALADDKTMNYISESKEAPEKIEKYIILQKNKNKELNLNLLSIFNNFADDKKEEFNISYISAEKELKVTPFIISSGK